MKGILHFRYRVHWLTGMCAWLDEALLKGAANPRSGLLPRVPCAGFHAWARNAGLHRQTVVFPQQD